MKIKIDNLISISQANQNFSKVAKTVESKGSVVILKNNKPKFLISNFDDNQLELTDDEKIDIVAKRVLEKYRDTFEALAK